MSLLGRPLWPSVSPDIDFVRSFGSIRKRKLGGMRGWIGEGALCEANRALRFLRPPKFRDAASGVEIPITVAFRRFYFDGLAVGKLEVGLTTLDVPPLNRRQTGDFINHCLNLPVTIPPLSPKAVVAEQAGEAVTTVLGRAGGPLARFYAACSISHPPPVKLDNWSVAAGTPLLFVVHKHTERINVPYFGKRLPGGGLTNCELTYHEMPYGGRTLRMWVLALSPSAAYRNVREIKICLLRLHAEHEVMRLVLQNIATNKINASPRTPASNMLQRYLNEATRRISRLGSQADSLATGDISELARESEDLMNPGERDALLDSLKNIDVRRTIFSKVQDYVNTGIQIQNQFYGSTTYTQEINETMEQNKYKIIGGSHGAVGDQAVNYGNIYNDWKQGGGDLQTLAQQLDTLRAELGKQANQASDYKAVAAVAEAAEAAKKEEGPTVFEHLKSAGQWAYDIALKVGVPVAVEALKKALGF
ncbi:MAG TPA: hypothetical protein VN282_13585 [Pyrinomonadaceae bacterium]|nr:hypothetical protein [Pyrinomonadaceae bacterium]